MGSPASAIAWEFRKRHLWALIAFFGYLLILGTIKLLVLGPGQPVKLDPPDGRAAVAIVPLSVTFMYLLAVFSFGMAGDLGGRPSIYPARMFTLPLSTRALAGWPMVCGASVMAVLWGAIALFARWPFEVDAPLIWPGLLAAAFLAWTQVLMWMPYGLPGLRVIVAVLWLASLDAIVMLAIHYQVRERFMFALLAPQLPLAYLAACLVLARARRGDVPDWRGTFARLRRIGYVSPDRRDPFPSPARAQLWFEWRQHGRSLPGLVGILLPFEVGLFFLFRHEPPALTWLTLLSVLLTPPFMAGFVAATVSNPSPQARDSHGVPPFLGTRPLTSAALIAARLKAAMWSTLVTWLLVLVAIPVGLTLSGTGFVVLERAGRMVEGIGMPRASVIVVLVLLELMLSTWKRLVQSLYVGLSGREWVIKASVFLILSLVVIIIALAQWIHDSGRAQAALWDALPWIPAFIVPFKMGAAAWVATRLYQSRLLSDQTLVKGAACWLAAVLALHGVLVWLVDAPFIASYFLLLVSILAIPLARLAAAPLALAWNRHR